MARFTSLKFVRKRRKSAVASPHAEDTCTSNDKILLFIYPWIVCWVLYENIQQLEGRRNPEVIIPMFAVCQTLFMVQNHFADCSVVTYKH